jgi:hypothetical protein
MQSLSKRLAQKLERVASYFSAFLWRALKIILAVIFVPLWILFVGAGVALFGFIIFAIIGHEIDALTPQETKDWTASGTGSQVEQIEKRLDFVKKYPASVHQPQALNDIERLSWQIAKPRTIGPECFSLSDLTSKPYPQPVYLFDFSYSDYLQKYPTGPHAQEARNKLEELCWEYAKTKSNYSSPVDRYLSYLEFYPEGKWASDAKSFVADHYYDSGVEYRNREYLVKSLDYMAIDDYRRENVKADLEDLDAWANAENIDTFDAFQQYLKAWPSGLEHTLAIGMMEYYGRWKNLPTSEKLTVIFGEDFTDSIVPKHDPVTVADKCQEDSDFVDLANGYVLVTAYHDDYRRRFYFGFDAPFVDRAKSGSIEFLKALQPDQVKQIVQAAWRKIPLTTDQRRQLKRLAVVALAHEKIFDSGYDQANASVLDSIWKPHGFEEWHLLPGFPKSPNPCYETGFNVFSAGITPTLFDFWYMRVKDRTKNLASAAFETIAEDDEMRPK